jgi:hypothetical protein
MTTDRSTLTTGLALLLAPWGLLIANASYAWATRNGGSDDTGTGALLLAAAHPDLFRVALSAAMASCLLLVPAVLGLMHLTRHRAPWLGSVGGGLMLAGYCCYFGVLSTQFMVIAMAGTSGPHDAFAHVLDAAQAEPSSTVVFLLFVLGNLVGTLLVGVALLHNRTVPAWAAAGILLWPPLHIVGLVVGSEWFEVAGALLQAVGMVAAGVMVLRHARSANPLPNTRSGAFVA